MLKQLAPRVLMPPSPKNSAWMASAIGTARVAPDGPSTMAAMVTPSAWPVVPPGSGKLNIITTNAKAAKTEMSGTTRLSSALLRRFSAPYHPVFVPAYNTAQVDGLKYPSGICIHARPPQAFLSYRMTTSGEHGGGYVSMQGLQPSRKVLLLA